MMQKLIFGVYFYVIQSLSLIYIAYINFPRRSLFKCYCNWISQIMVSSIAVITVLNYEMQIFHLLNILHFDYFLSSVIHHRTSPFTERAYTHV